MTTQQTDALRLAKMLTADEWPGNVTVVSYARECVAELRRQHARITELESQLAQRFDAADMATAAAQGFRAGAASVDVAQERPTPEHIEAMQRAWLWMENQAEAQSKGGHATFDLMMLRDERDALRAAIDSYPPPALEGWKWVPIEPTDAMWNAMMDWGTKKSEWLAILAAAPGPADGESNE